MPTAFSQVGWRTSSYTSSGMSSEVAITEPLGPALAVEEPAALDELEHAVRDRAGAEDLHLVFAQTAELRDQVTDPRPLRVELDPASEVIRHVAKV